MEMRRRFMAIPGVRVTTWEHVRLAYSAYFTEQP
jgi:hypothetical protein